MLHGAVLAACRAARYHLTQTSLALPANRMVRAAQTQMEHHIRLDWYHHAVALTNMNWQPLGMHEIGHDDLKHLVQMYAERLRESEWAS